MLNWQIKIQYGDGNVRSRGQHIGIGYSRWGPFNGQHSRMFTSIEFLIWFKFVSIDFYFNFELIRKLHRFHKKQNDFFNSKIIVQSENEIFSWNFRLIERMICCFANLSQRKSVFFLCLSLSLVLNSHAHIQKNARIHQRISTSQFSSHSIWTQLRCIQWVSRSNNSIFTARKKQCTQQLSDE